MAIALFASRYYRLEVLTPAELAPKQPRPPEPPEDCTEIRRAMALSARSLVSGQEKPIKITTPLGADETAIYRAVIRQWSSNEPAVLHVSGETFPIDATSFSDRAECGCLSGLSVESLLRASHSFHILTPSDLPGKGIRLVQPDKQRSIVARNDPDTTVREERSVNDAVENAFANGLFSMSEIVFDKERHYALVSYSFHCGLLCGSGALWAFEKVNGEWRKTDRECGGWIA